MRALSPVWLAVLGCLTSFVQGNPDFCSWQGLYLPPERPFLPAEYKTQLQFSSSNFVVNQTEALLAFNGTSSVSFKSQVVSQCVVLNAVNINISQIGLSKQGGAESQLCQDNTTCSALIKLAPKGQIVLDLGKSNQLSPGDNVTLAFTYTALLTHKGTGVYRTPPHTFINSNGTEEEGLIIASQHEDFYARQAVPSFDEPNLKARWIVSYDVPNGFTALANGQQISQQPGLTPGSTTFTFQSTPIMSSYLFAVVIGQLEHLEGRTADGKPVGVWCVPGKQGWLGYALQAAVGALDFYTNWTGVHLPLEKIDYVAVPGKGGAMENWGLLQFDERRFLVDPETEDAYGRYISLNVICHETSHQWFGDYITLEDFGEYTVNEGVTSFMEYKCMQAVDPSFLTQPLRHVSTAPAGQPPGVHEGPRYQALQAAAKPTTDSVVATRVDNGTWPGAPTDIQAYNFGSALIASLEGGFGEDAIQAGLVNLLHTFAYSNLRFDQVLATLQEAALNASAEGPLEGSPFFENLQQADFRPWAHDRGYPIVDVTTGQNGRLLVSQQTAVSFGQPASPNDLQGTTDPVNASSLEALWPVFLAPTSAFYNDSSELASPVTPISLALVESNDSSLQAPVGTGPSVISSGATGLYRVRYTSAQTQQLAAVLATLDVGDLSDPSSGQIAALVEASALIDDSFALLATGYVTPADAIQIARSTAFSPASLTGLGQFLLLKPLIDGLNNVKAVLSTQSSSCIDAAGQLPQQLLLAQATYILARLSVDGTFEEAAFSGPSDELFFKLSAGQVLAAAALQQPQLALVGQAALANGSSVAPDVRGAALKSALASAARPQGQ
ncbi:hypothetical protein WJX73_001509 [Symbiochloris irregularis]|uniref:Aminopeptidase n=1 Tax=Symbiochloris irregularis TaxID=706552 RepID=A0AAW1P457_9CHLO